MSTTAMTAAVLSFGNICSFVSSCPELLLLRLPCDLPSMLWLRLYENQLAYSTVSWVSRGRLNFNSLCSKFYMLFFEDYHFLTVVKEHETGSQSMAFCLSSSETW